jgi:HSP20 family protein
MPAKPAFAEPLLPFAAVNGDGAWSPPVDVREHATDYIVVADLPGVEPATIEVTADRDVLTITGVRRDRLRAGGVPIRLERPTGKLHRSLRLPAGCDGTKIQTRFRDGVLEIDVPKGLRSRPATRKEVITRVTPRPSARPSDPGATGRTKVARPRKTRRTAATREA